MQEKSAFFLEKTPKICTFFTQNQVFLRMINQIMPTNRPCCENYKKINFHFLTKIGILRK